MKRWLIPLGCLGALALLVALINWPTPASQLAEARRCWAARPFTRYRLIVERSDGLVSTTPSARSWNLIDLFSGRGCTRVGFIGPRRRVHALTPLP